MKFREIDGKQQVCFELEDIPSFGSDIWFQVECLDGLYCLLLSYLRNCGPTKQEETINKKRRLALLHIRKAWWIVKRQRLPLDVVKGFSVSNKFAKLKGFTVLG